MSMACWRAADAPAASLAVARVFRASLRSSAGVAGEPSLASAAGSAVEGEKGLARSWTRLGPTTAGAAGAVPAPPAAAAGPLRAARARAPRTEAAPARRHHQGNLDLVPERLRLTCSTRRGPGLLVAGLLEAGSATFGKPLGPAPAGAGGTGPGRSGSWAFVPYAGRGRGPGPPVRDREGVGDGDPRRGRHSQVGLVSRSRRGPPGAALQRHQEGDDGVLLGPGELAYAHLPVAAVEVEHPGQVGEDPVVHVGGQRLHVPQLRCVEGPGQGGVAGVVGVAHLGYAENVELVVGEEGPLVA